MSFVLRKNGEVIAKAATWHPRYFGEFTNTSYPLAVGVNYVWSDGEFVLAWEEDPSPPAPTADEMRIAANNAIVSQILNIEEKQARAVREAILGKATTTLQELENRIMTLRAGLRDGRA